MHEHKHKHTGTCVHEESRYKTAMYKHFVSLLVTLTIARTIFKFTFLDVHAHFAV